MLKLSAKIAERYPHGAIVGIRVNKVQCGVVCAKLGDADELVGLLNAATDLLQVARRARVSHVACNCHSTASPDIPCLSCAIDAALAKAKGGT